MTSTTKKILFIIIIVIIIIFVLVLTIGLDSDAGGSPFMTPLLGFLIFSIPLVFVALVSIIQLKRGRSFWKGLLQGIVLCVVLSALLTMGMRIYEAVDYNNKRQERLDAMRSFNQTEHYKKDQLKISQIEFRLYTESNQTVISVGDGFITNNLKRDTQILGEKSFSEYMELVQTSEFLDLDEIYKNKTSPANTEENLYIITLFSGSKSFKIVRCSGDYNDCPLVMRKVMDKIENDLGEDLFSENN